MESSDFISPLWSQLILGEHFAWIITKFKPEGYATNVVWRNARRWIGGCWMLNSWIDGLMIGGVCVQYSICKEPLAAALQSQRDWIIQPTRASYQRYMLSASDTSVQAMRQELKLNHH